MVGGREGGIVIMITWTSWISLIARNQIVTRGHSLICSQALVGSSRIRQGWISSPVAWDIFNSQQEGEVKTLKGKMKRGHNKD